MSGSALKEGTKYDDDKPRYDLLSYMALEEVVKVYTMGAKKYEDDNWRKGVKWSRIIAAMLRHIAKFMRGETYDEESGLNHMAHVAWGALALLEYEKTHPELDDRYFKPEVEVHKVRVMKPF